MPLRWLVLAIFVVSSLLNYLDRQILPALAPALQSEFNLSNADYGLVLGAFSIAYALSAPLAGLFIDRVGLHAGICAAVALWAVAGAATGFAAGLATLVAARAVLGVAQAGGVPAAGKAIATYLRPEERALGNALSQIGLGAGAFLAPPVAIWLARVYGWRTAFIATGAVTLLWIPVWMLVSRKRGIRVPASSGQAGKPVPASHSAGLVRRPELWTLIGANILSMTVYTLWSNWTTVYLVREHGLALSETRWLAALPAVFFNLGGLLGGWLSLRWMRVGMPAVPARLRAALVSALALVATAAVPLTPTAAWATASICFSAFWSSAMSVNLYTIPLDLWGAGRAAFAVSTLTAAYGAMQAVFSPVAGRVIDRWGFEPVCAVTAVLPLAGYLVLRRAGSQ
jgi:ACS family hexuronate transporter-like MFS transporter